MTFIFVAILCSFIIHASNIVALPIQKTSVDYADYFRRYFRLDGLVVPSLYHIKITPYLLRNEVAREKRFTFDGKVEITLQPTEADVNHITLHAKSLKINEEETKLFKKNQTDEKIQIISHFLDKESDKLTLKLKGELQLNTEYVLRIEYSGRFSDDMMGFYKSSYRNKNEKRVWVGCTKFEIDHARKTFPCFDEPRYKAQFEIEICRDKKLNSVSNTPLKEQLRNTTDCLNREKDIFKRTPKMSTYLVAFLVSNFKARKDTTDPNFSVIARPEAYDQTLFSFKIGKLLLKAFDNYLERPYEELGIKKFDLAAIPDFVSGAMENWGLSTFREMFLLHLPNKTSSKSEEVIGAVVSHEQAHQWFGNYVTLDWWSYTWLNEGFARLFEYIILDKVKPEWEMFKQFPLEEVQDAFKADSHKGAHPLSDESLLNSDVARKMFSSISYKKGAAVIRMVQHLLGEKNFKNALHNYLEENKEKTVVPENLFKVFRNEWEDADTLKDFDQFLKDFTEQVGYPLVSVRLSEDGRRLYVSQKRFLLSRTDGSDDSLLYTVPFSFTTNKELNFKTTKPSRFLRKFIPEIVIDLLGKVDFVICNIQQSGYYRVNYDENAWSKIGKYLNSKNYKKIHENNRGQIIDDLFNMARAGYLPYRIVLNTIEYMKREHKYIPWSAAFRSLSHLQIYFGHEKVFGKYIVRLTKNIYERLGFKEKAGESRLDKYNRMQVLNWACKYGNKDCITKATALFRAFAYNNTPVPVDLHLPVYCTGIREGDENDFDFLWNKFLGENVETEAVIILNSLGCTRNEKSIQKLISYALSSVRLQDRPKVISAICEEHKDNVESMLDYLIGNFKEVVRSIGIPDTALVFSSLAGKFTSKGEIEQLENFYEQYESEMGDYSQAFQGTIRRAKINLKWSGSFSSDILTIFEEKISNSVTFKSFNIFIMIVCFTIAIYG